MVEQDGGGGIMNPNLFAGELVRLTTIDPDKHPSLVQKWSHDATFLRLLDSDPARVYSKKQIAKWFKKENPRDFSFLISTLEGDLPIGDIGLFVSDWSAGDAYVGIGIGDANFWGKGFGTDAMHIILRYGFLGLNLSRVTLTVFGYNERAIKSYLKVGFKEEGRLRQWMLRDEQRDDLVYMGILRTEWESINPSPTWLVRTDGQPG
jgi:RimJ/RimL family protein N-acetyltransferase